MSDPEDSDRLKNYRRRLKNPYAYSEFLDESEQQSEQKIPTHEQSSHVYVLEDPYASLYEMEHAEPASTVPATAAPDIIRIGLSKRDFRKRCTGIFRTYIPPLEKGRLRAHHKAFIERNEGRSPEVRFALVRELQKYDLSDVRGIQPRFNRERDDRVEEKLEQIERKVLGNEG